MTKFSWEVHSETTGALLFMSSSTFRIFSSPFSLAGFSMILSRHVSHYIITYYLPSGLFVVVSWISFLVPPDVIPGKEVKKIGKVR